MSDTTTRLLLPYILAAQAQKHVTHNEALRRLDGLVIPPFLTGCVRRTYAAIFSFWAGVMPPMPMFGRSLLYVHSHCVACSCASSMLSMMY